MERTHEQIIKFVTACDELISAKYAAAEKRIADVLKAVAGGKELENLFSAVTRNFDYAKAKRSYLRFPAFAGAAHGAAYLPAERGDVLAFVFCLLVEFDAGAMPLGDFLLRYFYVDGSYTASYMQFAERMIVPFRDIVKSCFPESLNRTVGEELREKESEALSAAGEWAEAESSRAAQCDRNVGEKVAAEVMLSQIKTAVGRNDAAAAKALLCGYRYFLLYSGAPSEAAEGAKICFEAL
ncbi:MAG: hypothetical protein HFE26_02175 [Clostridia bacterium]|nr:hypothetical protein [Clostridia bacterium]